MATKPALKSVEKAEESVDEEAAPPKKRGKKILVIVLLLLILLGGGGGATWYFLMRKPAGEQAEKTEVKPSVYLPLETFTVNLQSDGSGTDHYLQIGITLQVVDEKVVDSVKQQLPLIRNKLLLLLSGKTPAELSNMEGKKKLAAEILAETRSSLPAGTTPNKGVQNVLFSSMIIQ